jgi:hypothetical protein
LIVFVDGFAFGHTMVGSLGVTADGTKVPLGVVEGRPRTRLWCSAWSAICVIAASTPRTGSCSSLTAV